MAPSRFTRFAVVSLFGLELLLFLASYVTRLPRHPSVHVSSSVSQLNGAPIAASQRDWITPPARLPGSTSIPDATTQRDPRDWTAPGSLLNPCTAPSPYYRARLQELAVMSREKGIDTATRCLNCLSAGQFPESCESQFGQDMFLYNNFFRCMDRPGVYIDVGAHRSMKLSTTWMLDACLGWKQGMCAEAHGGYAHELSLSRSCAVEEAALSVGEGFAAMDNGGAGGAIVNSTEGFRVRTTTLATALSKHKCLDPESSCELIIDFLTVDVEAHELEVLFGIPWDRVFIRFILVENVRATQDVFEFLVDKGYAKIFTIAVDDLYARVGLPLERSGRLEYHRRTVATMRRDTMSIPTYDHAALYKGWPHVNDMVKSAHTIPKE